MQYQHPPNFTPLHPNANRNQRGVYPSGYTPSQSFVSMVENRSRVPLASPNETANTLPSCYQLLPSPPVHIQKNRPIPIWDTEVRVPSDSIHTLEYGSSSLNRERIRNSPAPLPHLYYSPSATQMSYPPAIPRERPVSHSPIPSFSPSSFPTINDKEMGRDINKNKIVTAEKIPQLIQPINLRHRNSIPKSLPFDPSKFQVYERLEDAVKASNLVVNSSIFHIYFRYKYKGDEEYNILRFYLLINNDSGDASLSGGHISYLLTQDAVNLSDLKSIRVFEKGKDEFRSGWVLVDGSSRLELANYSLSDDNKVDNGNKKIVKAVLQLQLEMI
jgi:hypothetical protein